jgi:hypothetical protein
MELIILKEYQVSLEAVQGCHGDGRTDTSARPSVTSNKALVRPLSKYLSIFEHILENIHRICQLRPIPNGQNRPSVRPSRPYTTGLLPRPSSMTTLKLWWDD